MIKKAAFLSAALLLAAAIFPQSKSGEGGASPPSGTLLYVSAKTVQIKTAPGFFSPVVETLVLGDSVTLLLHEGKRLFVRGPAGLEGYAPADAFSTRRIIRYEAGITATEIALAGKGFNSGLEQFLRSAGDADYSAVDAMEKRNISPDEFRSFLREGRLYAGD